MKKEQRPLKVGDLVWYCGRKCRVYEINDPVNNLGLEACDGDVSWDFCKAEGCKIIYPRRKKDKKDKKVPLTVWVVPAIKQGLHDKANVLGISVSELVATGKF